MRFYNQMHITTHYYGALQPQQNDSITSKRLGLVVQTHKPLGGTEIRDLEFSGVHVDKDVVTFDVPVHNALMVEVLDAIGDVACVMGDGLLLGQSTPLRLQQRGKTP